MRIVPINEAEAIIEPFWDGGSSEHPTDKRSLLSDYQTWLHEDARGHIRQSWCAAEVTLDTAPHGVIAAALERDCDVDVSGYDLFRIFASVPHWVRMSLHATLDGHAHTLLDGVTGSDTHDEFDGALKGRRLTHLRIEFSLTEDRPAYIELLWLGLSNKGAQQRMEAQGSPYNAEWHGLLQPADAGSLKPQIGIFFGARELNALRRKVQAQPLRMAYAQLRQQAQQDMQWNPEADIGRYVPNPDRRWCRNRDMRRQRTAGVMERLAFVGLLDGNAEMSRMAARMALSAAHCDHWCESILGVFPGASWHHRSFTEEIYCRACALVLDWAGFCLTLHGQQVIRDAIIMKGLPRIESDFKRMEYIRHMNQGIVFSSGRIIGLLGVLPAYPRYASVIAEAERDLTEMIDSYVQPDGGTLEGMAYWNYTFGTALPLFYALGRYHGCANLREVRQAGGLPDSLIRTGDYALAMLSSVSDGATYLPINDAHADEHISPALIAAYTQISERKEWRSLYAATVQTAALTGDIYHLIFAPKLPANAKSQVQSAFLSLPQTGEVSSIRPCASVAYTHFHLSCGPILMTHYHQDRGSFILEANGEVLAMDRGVTTYDHPEVGLIGAAQRHNLLYPESVDGRFITQPPEAKGGAITSALQVGEWLMLACDNTLAWEPGVVQRSTRRVFSPWPDLFVFDDEMRGVDAQVARVSFRLNTREPVEVRDDATWVLGQRAALRIVPLNWTPQTITHAVEGIDSHLQPVNLLRIVADLASAPRLLTAIEVYPVEVAVNPDATALWRYTQKHATPLVAAQGVREVILQVRPRAALQVQASVKGRLLHSAMCKSGKWECAA
jgi:hypothetical protein